MQHIPLKVLGPLLVLMSCGCNSSELPAPDRPDPTDPSGPRDLSKFFADLDDELPKIASGSVAVKLTHFLGNPERMTTAVVQIREEFITDVMPPAAGRRKFSIVLSPVDCSWQAAEAHQHGDGAAPPQTGHLTNEHGKTAVLGICQRLQRAGWFDLPEQIAKKRGGFFAASRLTICIHLANADQHATLERTLPHGAEHDERYRAQANACRLILDEWIHRPTRRKRK